MKRITLCALFQIVLGSFVVAGAHDEALRGNYWDALLRDGFPLYEDREVNERVGEVGRRVAEASGNPRGVDFRFFVFNSSEPTAFGAPGGFVYITTGMLENLSNEDELAAVIAHEIGHINEGHALKVGMGPGARKFWSTLIALGSVAAGAYFGSVVADALPPDLAGTITQQQIYELTSLAVTMGTSAAGQQVVRSFYKGYEEEYEFKADELALDYAKKADYRPAALIEVFERLEEGSGNPLRGVSHLHSSAEMLDRRAAHARQMLSR